MIRTIDISKKEFNKPMMRVVKLQHEAPLLGASERYYSNPSSDTDRPYGSENVKMWDGEID